MYNQLCVFIEFCLIKLLQICLTYGTINTQFNMIRKSPVLQTTKHGIPAKAEVIGMPRLPNMPKTSL